MRRIGLILALAIGVVAAAPAPVSAHSCVTPVQVEAGTPSAINFLVPAEDAPVTEVTVHLPAAMELQGQPEGEGWEGAVDGQTIRYRGGSIEPFACGFFTIRGVITKPTTAPFPIETTDANGHVVEYHGSDPGNPYTALLVYAAAAKSSADTEATDSHRSSGPVVAIAAGVVLLGGLGLFSRRWSRPARRSFAPRARRGPAPPGSGSSRPVPRKRRRPPRR